MPYPCILRAVMAKRGMTIRLLCLSCFLFLMAACNGVKTSCVSDNGLTVIKNGTVLTMDENRTVYENGVVVVEGDSLIAIGGPEVAEDYTDAKIIDAEGGIIMPGLVNVHNHLAMVAFRGVAESGIVDFNDRLVNYFFPLEAKLLNRDLIRVASRHAAIESVLGGVTTTADMYYHEYEVAKALKQIGMRGVLGESVIGFPVVDAKEPYGGLAYAEKYIQDWRGDPLITPALAPHAPYTVSPEKLQETKALADKYGVPILIHMDEVENEEEITIAFQAGTAEGKTIVEYLDGLGFLGTNVIAAHTNYVTPTDIDTLKARGVGVSHNPKANTKDMSGLSPAWDMYKAGLNIGLGTDGPMSSNQMDMLNVMPYAVRISRIKYRDIAKFDPVEVIDMATMGGAKALGLSQQIGSLEVGKKADVIILETKSPNMRPNHDPYATVVFAAYPSNVALTLINGQIVQQDGVIRTLDMETHYKEWDMVMQDVENFVSTLK